MHHVFLRFGAGEILTDNGLEFRNELLSELCRLFGVSRCFTTSYQPRTNAVCERSHATVNAMLAKCVSDNHRDWDEWLPQIAFSYNASVHESTRFTPFYLMHGTEPRWDVDFKLGTDAETPYSENDYADVLLKRLEGAHSLTREHLQTTASRMSDWYDQKFEVQKFSPGDVVYVLNLRLYQGRCPKWLRCYSDVATVVRRINQVTKKYQIKKYGELKKKSSMLTSLKSRLESPWTPDGWTAGQPDDK